MDPNGSSETREKVPLYRLCTRQEEQSLTLTTDFGISERMIASFSSASEPSRCNNCAALEGGRPLHGTSTVKGTTAPIPGLLPPVGRRPLFAAASAAAANSPLLLPSKDLRFDRRVSEEQRDRQVLLYNIPKTEF